MEPLMTVDSTFGLNLLVMDFKAGASEVTRTHSQATKLESRKLKRWMTRTSTERRETTKMKYVSSVSTKFEVT